MKRTQSLSELARKNGIPRTTVQTRIANGMDLIDALCNPPDRASHNRKVTDTQILEVMALKLSISRNAYLLNIGRASLRARLKRIKERNKPNA